MRNKMSVGRFIGFFIFGCISLCFASSTSIWSTPFMLKDSLTTSVSDINTTDNAIDFSASPNPFNPIVHFSVTGLGTQPSASLIIYDIQGKKVADLTRHIHAPAHTISWNAAHYPSGIYLVALETNKHKIITRIALLR